MWQLSASYCLQWHNLYLQERSDGEFARTSGTYWAYRSNRATGCFWRYRSNWSCGSEWTNWSNGRNRAYGSNWRSRTAGSSGNQRDERHSDSYGHDQLYRLWHLPSRLDGSNHDDWPLHHGNDSGQRWCGWYGRLDKLHASRNERGTHSRYTHGGGSDIHGFICKYQRSHGWHSGRH